jgi:RNA polymerase sigma-70 factor, ECF subfamily
VVDIELTAAATAVAPFDVVYQDNAAAVYRFCLSQIGRADEAEDVAADAFASAFAAYDMARPAPDRVRAWLFQIARNAIIDHWRRESRRFKLLDRLRLGTREHDETADVERHALHRVDISRLVRLMSALSPRDRLLVGMRGAAELSYAEIGQLLGISEHAAVVAGRRAFSRLRAIEERTR